jgi:hypothetical protein
MPATVFAALNSFIRFPFNSRFSVRCSLAFGAPQISTGISRDARKGTWESEAGQRSFWSFIWGFGK